MNPELVHAVVALLARQAQVQAQGQTVTDDDREGFLRTTTHGKFGWADAKPLLSTDISAQNLARSAAQGATMNTADEMLEHAPAALNGGADAAALMRAQDEAFKKEHPIADFAARGVGTVATLALPWAKIAEAIGLGPAVAAGARALPEASTAAGAAARAALQTGAVGAASAAGSGSGVQDRLTRGAIGGVTGAVLGGVTGGVAAKVIEALPKSTAARRVADAVTQSGGAAKVKATLQQMEQAGRGDVAILGDLSPNLQRATDYAANNNPNTYSRLSDQFNARQSEMGHRMLGDVEQMTGSPNAEAELRQLQASNKAWADQAYSQLRAENPSVPLGPTEALTTQPKVGGAFQGALAAGQIGPTPEAPYAPSVAPDPTALGTLGAKLSGAGHEPVPAEALQQLLKDPVVAQTLRDAGHGDLIDAATGAPGTDPSFRTMLSLKGRLNGLASSAYTRGDGDLGSQLMSAHDALTDHLKDVVPGFKEINAEFAARRRLEEAVTGGIEAWNNPKTRLLSSDIDALPPAEQDLYRRAMASQLVDWLRSVSKNQNEAGRVVNASDAMEDKLHAIFKDEPTFDQYVERAKAELTMARTKNAIGGSQTHLRDAESMFDPLEMFKHGAPSPLGLWASVLRATKGKLNANVADQMGQTLGTQGTSNIDAVLQQLMQRSQRPLLNPTAVKAGAAGVGSLFSQF